MSNSDSTVASSPAPTPASRARQADRAASRQAELAALPWYRRESWLAIILSAVVPIGISLLLPQTLKLAAVGVGGLLVLIGIVLLARHKPQKSWDDPDALIIDER